MSTVLIVVIVVVVILAIVAIAAAMKRRQETERLAEVQTEAKSADADFHRTKAEESRNQAALAKERARRVEAQLHEEKAAAREEEVQ